MKIGRRSKHVPSKGLFSGPLLGRLNRREKQELADKSAAAKPVAKARRLAFGLETVEPRLLMSAQLITSVVNDTITLAIGGTSAAPTVVLTDHTGQLASAALNTASDTEIDVNSAQVIAGQTLSAGDTLDIDLTNFAKLDSFVGGNGGQLTIKFDGGNEQFSSLGTLLFNAGTQALGNLSGIATADSMNIDNSASVSYGLTIQSTSSIASSANLTASNLTITSAQTAGDLLTTGLFANADTGIDLTGASLTTTAGALTLNAQSTLNVSTDGTGMSAVKGALITSFSNAAIDIGGSSVLTATGGDLDITASVNGSLTASAGSATVKLVVIAGSAAPSVTIDGGSQVASTTGAVDAQATTNVTINSSTAPITNSGSASVDAAVLSTTFADGATMTVDGGAGVSAKTSDTLAASSTLTSSTVANAAVPKTAGAAVAVSVITGDTTASVADATVSGSSVSATAGSDRSITTTAMSSPGGSSASGSGSNDSEQTLGSNDAATSSGSITVAGAIAVSVDTGTTSAFLASGAIINAGAGAATVSAGSADVVAVTADGEFTQAGTTGVGVGVAIGVADRTDAAYITGTVAVTAGTLDVAVLVPSASSFSASATSGVAIPPMSGSRGRWRSTSRC